MTNFSPILFPNNEILNYKELYFRGNNFVINKNNIYILSGGRVETNTYYNSLSIEKWRHYTNLNDVCLMLRCKGNFEVRIINSYLSFEDVVSKNLDSFYFNSNGENFIKIDLNKYKEKDGILYFEIIALSETIFYSGGYYTNKQVEIPNISIVICTYKREQYIEKFLKNLQNYDYRNYLEVFIVDNGNTLHFNKIDSNIHIIPNRNYGGAGGFARGMLEVKEYNEKEDSQKYLDYIVLMDDDIYIDLSIFNKLFYFLFFLKKEYANYFFAGTMCSWDDKKIQYERYAKWLGNSFRQMSPNYNLESLKCILKNEKIEHLKFTTAGWWFCCYSTNLITPNNFPFPCFFRGDDVEFTIRNCSNIITLNGINVWHEPFYKKYSIVSEDYYLLRNTLVLNTLYFDWITAKYNIMYLFKRFAKSIIKYDYNSAMLIIRALIDYSHGPKFFMDCDPELLNKELGKYNNKLVEMNQLMDEFVADDLVSNVFCENDRNKIFKFIRFITINGNLIPSFLCRDWSVSFVGYGSRAINFYRTKKVLNYDPYSQKGYYTQRSVVQSIKLTIKFFKIALKYIYNFKKIKKDYQCNFYILKTEHFWKKYLKLDED